MYPSVASVGPKGTVLHSGLGEILMRDGRLTIAAMQSLSRFRFHYQFQFSAFVGFPMTGLGQKPAVRQCERLFG